MTLCGPMTEEEIAEHNANITSGELLMATWDGTEATLYNLFILWGKEMPANDMRYSIESWSPGKERGDLGVVTLNKLGYWKHFLVNGDRIVRTADMEIRIDHD